MATRGDFTVDEWELLIRGFTRPGELVSLAEPGGTIQELFHMFVAFSETRKQFENIPLIRDLLEPLVEEEVNRRVNELRASSDQPITFERYRTTVLNDLGQAIQVLRRKASPAEVDAYKDMVLHVCQRVASAYREGNLFGVGGVAVAPAEQSVIDSVEKVLAGPRGWPGQLVDEIKALFR